MNSSQTFKLTGLDNSQRSSFIQDQIQDEIEKLSDSNLSGEEVPKINLDGDVLSPEENDILENELIRQIHNYKVARPPYIENIKVANYCLTQTQTKLIKSINQELEQKRNDVMRTQKIEMQKLGDLDDNLTQETVKHLNSTSKESPSAKIEPK